MTEIWLSFRREAAVLLQSKLDCVLTRICLRSCVFLHLGLCSDAIADTIVHCDCQDQCSMQSKCADILHGVDVMHGTNIMHAADIMHQGLKGCSMCRF